MSVHVVRVIETIGSAQVVVQASGTAIRGRGGPPGVPPFSLPGEIDVLPGQVRYYLQETCALKSVRASLGTPATGADVGVTVKKNGVAVAAVTVPAGQHTAIQAVTPVALAAGDYLTVDVTAVGSTNPGSALVVQANIE